MLAESNKNYPIDFFIDLQPKVFLENNGNIVIKMVKKRDDKIKQDKIIKKIKNTDYGTVLL